MKTQIKFLKPNNSICFFGGFLSGTIFYTLLYFIFFKYLQLPVERMLGPVSDKGISYVILIYIMLYVLFFWGLITISLKNRLVYFEYLALDNMEQTFQSTTIISKRTELDNLRAVTTSRRKGNYLRKSALVQTILFLIDHCLVTESSDRVIEIFTRRMDTLQKHIESSYNILRYIAWAIPSLGFIGTVLGIGSALSKAGLAIGDITIVTQPLGMAFDTTLIALVESIILMFFIYNMQNKEENLLNTIDLFCQEKFIINLRLKNNE